MASWDEDSVTMALEAGRQLLHALPNAAAAELTLASTTLPFADRLNAGIVASAEARRLAAEARCRAAKRFYLLTTTAEAFFARRGFERIARQAVPAAIASTKEFNSLCPSSAICMTRAVK